MLIPFLRAKLREFVRNESGATAIEYGLIAGLIAVAIIISIQGIGADLLRGFQLLDTELDKVAPAN